MKSFLKKIFINFLAILLVASVLGSIKYSNNILIIIWAAFFLTLLNLLIKPILNLLLMPINLLTLGAFRWVINCIVLFMVTVIVPEFRIVSFTFSGFDLKGFIIPQMHFPFFWALILVSFFIEIASSAINWLFT